MDDTFNTRESGGHLPQSEEDGIEYGHPHNERPHHTDGAADALWNHTRPEYLSGYSSAERLNTHYPFSGSLPHYVPIPVADYASSSALPYQSHPPQNVQSGFSGYVIPASGSPAPQPLYSSTPEHSISPPQYPFLNSSSAMNSPGAAYLDQSLNPFFSGTASNTQNPWEVPIGGAGEEYDLDYPENDGESPESGPSIDESTSSISSVEGKGKGPKGSTRKSFSQKQKQKVHAVRKAGACVRCQFFRESCDQETPCGRCKAVETKRKTWNLPCVRMNLTEAQLFRGGNSKFKQSSVSGLTIKEWNPDSSPRPLRLGRLPHLARLAENGLPDNRKYPTFTIKCREFVPRPDDLLHETWRDPDGNEVKLPLPPVAAVSDEDISTALKNFVRLSFEFFEYDMVHGPDRDPLVGFVFEQAIKFTRGQHVEQHGLSGEPQHGMLKSALHIWVLSRLASEGFTIVGEPGEETFGIERVNDPNSPYNGQIPLPPVLDHQLDHIGILHMVQCKIFVLRQLKTKLAKRKEPHKYWLEIFLTMFVLLDNLELVWRAQLAYAKRHKDTATGIQSGIQHYYHEWASGWERAADILITHFHITKAPKPYSTKPRKKQRQNIIDGRDSQRQDTAWLDFVADANKLRRGKEEEFKRLASMTKEERAEDNTKMLWTSRLFADFPET